MNGCDFWLHVVQFVWAPAYKLFVKPELRVLSIGLACIIWTTVNNIAAGVVTEMSAANLVAKNNIAQELAWHISYDTVHKKPNGNCI